MAYICVLSAKQARGTNLNKNISGKFLILILVTKTINSNKLFNKMIFNRLRPQLCLVQAAIFPGILKANTKSLFWQGESKQEVFIHGDSALPHQTYRLRKISL